MLILMKDTSKIWFIVIFIMIKRGDDLPVQPEETRRHENWQELEQLELRCDKTRTLPRLYIEQENLRISSCADEKGMRIDCRLGRKDAANRNSDDNKHFERIENINGVQHDRKSVTFKDEREFTSRKKDQKSMELQGLQVCYEPLKQITTQQSRDKLRNTVHDLHLQEFLAHDSFDEMPSPNSEERMKELYIESKTTRQLVENYCKVIKELEVQRMANFELCQSRDELENELKILRKELTTCKASVENETSIREKIQHDLRKLADSLEREHVPGSLKTTRITSSAVDVESIEYYRDQFRIYQEDFKEEKEEKEKLRVLNLKLTSELEEAKREIESYQKKHLVYAQIFSNNTPTQMVIPPAYIGRRVHSNPTTPSYSHGQYSVPGRNPYQITTQQENLQRRAAAYDKFLDVVPKGSCEMSQAKFSFDVGFPSKPPLVQEEISSSKENDLNRKRSCSLQS